MGRLNDFARSDWSLVGEWSSLTHRTTGRLSGYVVPGSFDEELFNRVGFGLKRLTDWFVPCFEAFSSSVRIGSLAPEDYLAVSVSMLHSSLIDCKSEQTMTDRRCGRAFDIRTQKVDAWTVVSYDVRPKVDVKKWGCYRC
jgi:hypothetical protein